MSSKFNRRKFEEAMASSMAYYTRERVVESEDQLLEISLLDPYPNQPYQVKMDDAMQELIDSISDTGLIQPIIVRVNPEDNKRYQIISGHRRVYACKALGHKVIKAVVKEMDDDTAIMYLIDSNKYRPEILPSEKAHAYKLRMDALKRQGKRTDLTCVPLEHKLGAKTRDAVGEETGESASQIQRYMRLTELIPELMDAVDDKQLKMRPAVEISYLPHDAQEIVFREVISEGRTLSYEQAKTLKEKAKAGGKITETDVRLAAGLPNEDKVRKRLKLTKELKILLPKEVQRDIVKQEKYLAECIQYYQEHQKAQ